MKKKHGLYAVVSLFIMISSFAIKADSTPAPDAGTGIEGAITISPSHPGPIREDEVNSPKGIPNTEFVVKNEKGVVASFTTDDQGKFRVLVPAGHYTVSLKSGRRTIGRFGPFSVEVAAGKVTQVNWQCDSGMR